jgi:sugar lactone lactonase YvrE
LNSPDGVAFDTAGNLYIADTANNRIRKVNTAGIITTTAGGGAANQLVGIDTAAGTTSETLHLQNGIILLGSE